jgi:hypothetical protein
MAAMIVDTGKASITALLVASTDKYVGWGTSATAEAHGQTDLQAAGANESRATGTPTQQTTTYTNDTWQVLGQITCATAGKTIQEVGVFDAAGTGTPASGGNLILRAVHGAQILNVGDSIEYTIKTQFT